MEIKEKKIPCTIKAVIFDMDGLMFNTEQLSLDCWVKSGKQFNYTVEKDVILKSIGIDAVGTKQILAKAYGEDFPFEKIDEATTALLYEHYDTEGVPVKAGLFEMLKYCKNNNLLMAVATSSNNIYASQLLEKSGAAPYFDAFVFGNEVEKGKPEPDIFIAASNKLGVEPIECIVLEDSENGIKAASLAGMTPIHVPDLIRDTPIIKEHAKFICESLMDGIEIINALIKRK